MQGGRRAPPLPKILVVGVGRLGGALASGYQARGGWTRAVPHSAVSRRTARTFYLKTPTPPEWKEATLCFLCVPDAAVALVATEVAPKLSASAALVHCAGALTLEGFGTSTEVLGRDRGSFHPLRGMASPRDSIAGAIIALSASSRSLLFHLRQVATLLEATTLRVPERERARYHASAVMSSAGVVALLSLAAREMREAGLSEGEARRAVLSLATGALGALERYGFERSLTGPWVRGDAKTVSRNLSALSGPGRVLYRGLMREGLKLVRPKSPRE